MHLALPKRRPLRIAALAGLVVAFVLVTTGIIATLFPATAAASSSSLEVLDGIVALSHDGTTFTEGHDGDLVQQGDVVRTGSASHAVLTFYDGTTVEVEPDSELVVQTLQATTGGDLVMQMQQTFGRSWHVVSRALTPNSKYEVRTPTATATVRGTAFLVTVNAAGGTNLQTTEGIVHAIAGGEEVQVPPGFQTNVQPGGTPPEPIAPAPAPQSLVRVLIDPTPNAVIVDANGRAVGLLNGLPVRYIPGSTVQLVDGKLVITIPNPTLGRIDTHVQPADPSQTKVEVNVQVQVGGEVVGNVTETRTIDSSGIAKGGVVLTTTGTYLIPDEDAKAASDPHIGRLPPPPGGGLPFFAIKPAPTPIVTPAPSFVPRFGFDPRLVAATTPTPAPPTPAPAATFNGAYQPYNATLASSSATPAPNSNLTVFQTPTPELRLLTAATPTPTPTLTTKLLAPLTLTTPTPTPQATLILRTLDPIILLATSTPTATVAPILRTLDPIFLFTASPTPTPAPTLILRTLDPIFIIATPTPTFAPSIIRTLDPIFIATPSPTPVPTLILRTLDPIIIITTPAPTPTIAPILRTLSPILLPTASPTPAPTIAPILQTVSPIIFQTPAPTSLPTLRPICGIFRTC